MLKEKIKKINLLFLTKDKGFTMIELLVVIAIIGILSTLAIVSLNSARAKARDALRFSDIRNIATAIDVYVAENEHAPYLGAADCRASVPDSTCSTLDYESEWTVLETELSEYLHELPTDPCGENCPGAGDGEDPFYAYEYVAPANIAAHCADQGCGLNVAQLDYLYSIYALNMEQNTRTRVGFSTSW